jgi:hypothetical protein
MYGQKMEVEKWDQQYTPTYIGYCTYGQKMEVEKWDQRIRKPKWWAAPQYIR